MDYGKCKYLAIQSLHGFKQAWIRKVRRQDPWFQEVIEIGFGVICIQGEFQERDEFMGVRSEHGRVQGIEVAAIYNREHQGF